MSYTIRQNQANLKPWELALPVKHFINYTEASDWLAAQPNRTQLHLTVDH